MTLDTWAELASVGIKPRYYRECSPRWNPLLIHPRGPRRQPVWRVAKGWQPLGEGVPAQLNCSVFTGCPRSTIASRRLCDLVSRPQVSALRVLGGETKCFSANWQNQPASKREVPVCFASVMEGGAGGPRCSQVSRTEHMPERPVVFFAQHHPLVGTAPHHHQPQASSKIYHIYSPQGVST